MRNPFAVELVQPGFVFERIHLTDAAAHEEHDAILGLSAKRGRLDRQRIDDGRSAFRLARQEAREREPAEAVEHPPECKPHRLFWLAMPTLLLPAGWKI